MKFSWYERTWFFLKDKGEIGFMDSKCYGLLWRDKTGGIKTIQLFDKSISPMELQLETRRIES